jgi:curved DNA-binding protein CbpA
MIQFCRNLKPSHYAVIGVPRYEIDEKLRTHFRHMMVNLHPDKNPDGGTEKFMQTKQIYEVLNNDITRVAYDCYGPDVLRTVSMSSAKSSVRALSVDYFSQALLEWIGFYASTAVFFILVSGMSNKNGLFWRGLGLFIVASIDLYVITRPSKFGVAPGLSHRDVIGLGQLMRWWGRIPAFQKLAFLRQAYTYAGMAFGQIVGLNRANSSADIIKNLAKRAEDLSKTALSKEAEYHIASAVEPVSGNPEMRVLLNRKMGKLSAEMQLYDILDSTDRQRLASNDKKLN